MTTVTELPTVTLADIEVFVDKMDVKRAAATYKRLGCLVVRGLMRPYAERIRQDAELLAQQAISLLDRAKKVPEGWTTPDGSLFLPAPAGFSRDKQIMVLAMRYSTSAAMFQSAQDPRMLDLLEAIIGPDIEMFMNGQCLYKEPVGGHAKKMHQDSAYFEHRFEGPTGVLCYCVDTTYVNGALHVVPGSHQMGQMKHVDTTSHLGLNEDEWPVERGLCVEGKAGDAIFFNVKTIHGSPVNKSDKARPVFIHRYRRPDDFITVGGTSTQNRAEAEKRAAEAKRENEQGFMVRGLRRFVEG